MEKTSTSDSTTFIDFELIRNSLKFENENLFTLYLKDIYEDLNFRDSTFSGISKLTFNEYVKIPVFISEKLFSSLDKDNNGYLDEKEFITGFTKLFLGNFSETANIIFNIYDYDKDGLINKGDIKVLLSYLPLKSTQSNEMQVEYKHQMKSLEELDEILAEIFNEGEGKNRKSSLTHSLKMSGGGNLSNHNSNSKNLNFTNFLEIIQNKKSDIYIQLLCFLYQNKPFQTDYVNSYKNFKSSFKNSSQSSSNSNNSNFMKTGNNFLNFSHKKNLSVNLDKNILNQNSSNENTKIPSPSKMTNFISTKYYIYHAEKELKKHRMESPEIIRSKDKKTSLFIEPSISSNSNSKTNNLQNNHLNTKSVSPIKSNNNKNSAIGNLSSSPVKKANLNSKTSSEISSKNKTSSPYKNNTNFNPNSNSNGKEVIRMTNSKIITQENKGEEMPLINLLQTGKNLYNSPSVFFKKTSSNDLDSIHEFSLDDNNGIKLIPLSKESSSDIFSERNSSNNLNSLTGNNLNSYEYEDVIYKFDLYSNSTTSKTLSKYYMVLQGKEITIFSSNDKKEKLIFHNLSGCFLKDESLDEKNNSASSTIIINKVKYSQFTIVYSKNIHRTYYTLHNKEDSNNKKWIDAIKKAIGYQSFFDSYEILQDIDEGRFGQVKLGLHKSSKEKVAIKVIKKVSLTEKEMEMQRNELDVLKLFRHPNIVRLLDHFENDTYMYIVLEFLSGGNLIKILDQNNSYLTEKQCGKIIYSIAQGIKYMNSFGIIHRDIKPENIMLENNEEGASIKIIDFGLTKTLAPGEKLSEGMGTITFVAPEIITRKPYNRQIDIWSLGALLYLLISGELPFDDETGDEEKIAKKIVYLDHHYDNERFKGRSIEVEKLIDACLNKNPDKRITIEEFLKNDWVKMNYK